MARYEIIMRNDTDGNNRSPIAGSGASGKNTTSEKNAITNGGQISQARVGIAKGWAAVNTYIKPFVDQVLTQKITTIELRTGAQELEDKMSFAYSIGQKAYSFGTSLAMGALVGGLPGAVIGGVMSLATMAIDYSNKQQKIDLQRTVENVGLQFMNIRAGGSVASFNGSRSINQ